MDTYEGSAVHNLAETCCASISLAELQQMSGAQNPLAFIDKTKPLTYGSIRGSLALRDHIAKTYGAGSITANDVLITNGAISANFLSLYTLISPGDHVVCQYPTYQQLYSIPESLGAEVTLWKAQLANRWTMSYEELEAVIRPNTKMIILK
jgi:aspartate/methionine/tyrosine aminotransferase